MQKMHFSLSVDKYKYTMIYTCLACLWDGCNKSYWARDKYVWYLFPFAEDSNSLEVAGGTICSLVSSSLIFCVLFFLIFKQNTIFSHQPLQIIHIVLILLLFFFFLTFQFSHFMVQLVDNYNQFIFQFLNLFLIFFPQLCLIGKERNCIHRSSWPC